MGITYDRYFIKIFRIINFNINISHTKRVNFFIICIKLIDKFLIFAHNKHRGGCFSKDPGQYFPNYKKTDKCDQKNQGSVSNLLFESSGRCLDAHADCTLSRPCSHLTQPRAAVSTNPRHQHIDTAIPPQGVATLRTVRSTYAAGSALLRGLRYAGMLPAQRAG